MIITYGSPKNYDAQCPEHNHKYTAKIPGCRSQKTNVASEFECQVANRVSEAMIIDELHYIINDIDANEFVCDSENDDNSIIAQSTKNASFASAIKSNGNNYIIKWKKNNIIRYNFQLRILLNLFAKNTIKIKSFFAQNIAEQILNSGVILTMETRDLIMTGYWSNLKIINYIHVN